MSNNFEKESHTLLKNLNLYTGSVDSDWNEESLKGLFKLASLAGLMTNSRTQQKSITITAGHGGRDCGASNGFITESEIATDMRNMVVFYLKRAGIEVTTDGKGNENAPLSKAIKLAKQSDIAIEFHTNSFWKPEVSGIEALALRKDIDLCQKLCGAISEVLDIKTRGNKGGYKDQSASQHSRLGYVQAGGILVELFFLSNPEDLKKYQAKKWLVAKAISEILIKEVEK